MKPAPPVMSYRRILDPPLARLLRNQAQTRGRFSAGLRFRWLGSLETLGSIRLTLPITGSRRLRGAGVVAHSRR